MSFGFFGGFSCCRGDTGTGQTSAEGKKMGITEFISLITARFLQIVKIVNFGLQPLCWIPPSYKFIDSQ